MPGSGEGEADVPPAREAWARLEEAIARCLRELHSLRNRAERAEERVRRMEALMEEEGEGADEPGRIVDRIRALEEENRDLRDRLQEGREAVDRMLARIRFLEEQQ